MSAPQATTPAQALSVVPVAKPAEVSAAAKSRDEAPKAEEQKKTAATTQGGATAPAAPTSKAATLTGSGGQGVNTLSPASAVPASTGPASAGAAPKAKSAPVPPMSAAAVVEEGKKPVTAAERLAGTGSALAKGVGAKAEPQAKPKAKAKMSAIPSRPLPTDTMGSAPTAVLNMVSGKPVPASQVGTSAYATSTVGPARAYAKAAAGAVSGEVPKAGPPAVAMGRAMAAGRPAMSMVNGKPVTTITKKYQLVFVTGEVAPFSKTGGLGEAMDGLPIALAAMGHRCMVISPRYDQYAEAWDTGYWGSVTMGGKQESVHFFHTYKQKVDYVFVDHPTFLERVNGQTGSKLYGPEWGKDFADNQAACWTMFNMLTDTHNHTHSCDFMWAWVKSIQKPSTKKWWIQVGAWPVTRDQLFPGAFRLLLQGCFKGHPGAPEGGPESARRGMRGSQKSSWDIWGHS